MREETYDISGMHCAACSTPGSLRVTRSTDALRWSGLHVSSPAWSEAM